jgi:hypothetical protein
LELRLLVALEGPQWAPRPKWRLIAGGVGLGVGVGFIGFGAAAVALNGRCVSPDMNGNCSPVLGADGQPVLPRTAKTYNTTALGAGLLSVGAAFTVAGTLLMALPGKRIRPQVAASITPNSAGVGFKVSY